MVFITPFDFLRSLFYDLARTWEDGAFFNILRNQRHEGAGPTPQYGGQILWFFIVETQCGPGHFSAEHGKSGIIGIDYPGMRKLLRHVQTRIPSVKICVR